MTLAMTETPPIFRKIAFDAVERARALIFDCDGTLVATLPLYGRAWAHGLRCSGKEMPLDDVTRGKPFPDLFLEAARRLRMNPSDCLVFEDTEEGLLAAQRAGMVAIDVRSLVAPGACDFEKRSFA